MGKTSIEWTQFSINPFRARNLGTGAIGHYCVKCSAGCKFCYSSRLQPRFGTFPFVVENRPKVELFLDKDKLLEVATRKKPTTWFWCDMTDMFLDDYPDEWIDQCIGIMAWTRQHTHQVLTKRSKRMMEYSLGMQALAPRERSQRIARSKGFEVPIENCGEFPWPLPNVWFMVSVEDQPNANERIPELLATPAAIRGVSYEPALGAVDFTKVGGPGSSNHIANVYDGNALYVGEIGGREYSWTRRQMLHWIIVGGESGPGARPFDIGWARSVIAQCKAAGVACFVKQVGSAPIFTWDPEQDAAPKLRDRKGGDWSEWPEDLRVREMPR